MSLFNPVLLLLFWKGSATKINYGYIFSYYLLLMIAGSLLISHIEEEVAFYDIKEGRLSSYLLKPFSYYWLRLLGEMPYRMLQGVYGVIVFGGIIIFTHSYNLVTTDVIKLFLSLWIITLAWFLSFTLQLTIGYIAFWVKDITGLFGSVDILRIVFGGFVMPIAMLPPVFKTASYILPFAYSTYFPVISMQGQLSYSSQILVIGIQLFWLGVLLKLSSFMWKKGIYKFSGVGQ